MRQQATAIRLLALGQRPAEVAESLVVQPTTVHIWFRRFRQDRLDGLANRPKGWPKRKADEAYCRVLEEAIERDPGDYGYPFAVWTVERLRDHLEQETGVHMSFSRLQVVFRQQGYVYRRPNYTLANLQDREAKDRLESCSTPSKMGARS